MPPNLYQRLFIEAEQQGKTLSALVTHLIERAINAEEDSDIERLYEGLGQLKGIGSRDVTDASITINETLYGEQGAWRGHNE